MAFSINQTDQWTSTEQIRRCHSENGRNPTDAKGSKHWNDKNIGKTVCQKTEDGIVIIMVIYINMEIFKALTATLDVRNIGILKTLLL